jgi:hypothetical protein
VAECEAIEKHVKPDESPKPNEARKKKITKFGKLKGSARKSESVGKSDLYCSEHAKNDSHNTNKYWTLENHRKAGSQGNHKPNNHSFSKNSF